MQTPSDSFLCQAETFSERLRKEDRLVTSPDLYRKIERIRAETKKELCQNCVPKPEKLCLDLVPKTLRTLLKSVSKFVRTVPEICVTCGQDLCRKS